MLRVLLRRAQVATARRADGAREMSDGGHERIGGWRQWQLRGLFPHPALDHETGGHGRYRVGSDETRSAAGDLHHLLDDLARVLIVAELEVRVHHVVDGVIRLVGLVALASNLHRALVGAGRFLPGAHAREDVRGHVQRMGRVGSDARVAPCGHQPLRRDGRRVVAVDQVVRDTGVVRVLLELPFEDGRSLEIRRIRLVGLRLRAGAIQRVERLRLVILRIACRELLVRIRPGDLPRALAAVGPVLVIDRYGIDVVALPLRARADVARVLEGRDGLLRARGRGARAGERVAHEDRGQAPCRDGALRVLGEHVFEGLLARAVPKRVQHRHAAFEFGLHLLAAGVRERDLAEAAPRDRIVFMGPCREWAGEKEQ